MSAEIVNMCRVACDTCGKVRDTLSIGSTAARIEAAGAGWKYAQYDVKGKGLTKRVPSKRGHGAYEYDKKVPRQWDSCPDCPLPSLDEAMAIFAERYAEVSA